MTASAHGGLRIAFLLPDLGGGGAERVALRLMEEALDAGNAVDLLLVRRAGALLEFVPADVQIVDLGVHRLREAIGPLRRYLRRTRPDSLHVFMWPLTVVAAIAHRLARSTTRLMFSEHSVLGRQYAGSPIRSLSLRITTRVFYRRADALVCVSTESADELARLSGVSRADIHVINNPVGQRLLSYSVAPDVDAAWRGNGHRIITVGSLKREKNHALLVRAFARLRRTQVAQLLIVGEGPLREELEALIAALGLGDSVFFVGFVTDPWPYLQSAELFVLSSDLEGYPLVLIEALRAGLPLVSTDSGSGARLILDDGRFGRLVPAGDEQALCDAVAASLSTRVDPAVLDRHAERLSGQDKADAYLSLMMGSGASS